MVAATESPEKYTLGNLEDALVSNTLIAINLQEKTGEEE